MKRWKTILGITLIFIAGLLAGWLGSTYYGNTRHPFHRQSVEERTRSIMKRLDDKLDLTDAQWAGMEVIVRQTQEETAKIFKDQGKKVHGLMERDMEAFKKILNPDQQQKLEELHRKFEERRKKRDKD